MLPDRYNINDYAVSEALKRHASWLMAYDEEGVEGQDEATIKPNDLGDPALPGYVTVEVTFADGTRTRGLAGGDFGVASLEDLDDMRLYHDGVTWCFDLMSEPCEQSWPLDKPFFDIYAHLLPMRVTAPLAAVFEQELPDLMFTVDATGVVTPGGAA